MSFSTRRAAFRGRPAGGEQVIVGTENGAVDPVIQGYEIVDVNNDTLEVGFHVGFVTNADASGVGILKLARYEIPVYDILVDANGLPILDGTGQGQLQQDAFGNLTPSTTATFGTGSETAPISIGLDGLRGDGRRRASHRADGSRPVRRRQRAGERDGAHRP